MEGIRSRSGLNEIEYKVLQELFLSSKGNGHDFGFTDEVDCEKVGITRHQLSGFISQLEQKGWIICYGREYQNQFQFDQKGCVFFNIENSYEYNFCKKLTEEEITRLKEDLSNEPIKEGL